LTAFPAEAAEEELLERDPNFFDEVVDDEDVGDDTAAILQQEQDMLEELPLPGTPEHEKDRRRKWLALPRPARAAIRRMRTQFGHCPKAPLYEILKAAKCPREYFDSCKYFRRESCGRTQHLPKQTHKVALPKPYVFNHTAGIDINFVHDCDGETYMLMNIVDIGTGFQIECYLHVGHGTPKSLECLEDAFMLYWVSWAGYLQRIVSDRGLNNRGAFCKELSAAGVICASIGLEAPYQLGKVERKGGVWEDIAQKVTEAKQIEGIAEIRLVIHEVNAVVNEMSRAGGFSPA
jgi:hypothetical protein